MNFFGHSPGGLSLIIPFITKVFPVIDTELAHWSAGGIAHACPELKMQALSSIRSKKFHCQGGSVYSLYPTVERERFIPLVVALQTISDYLDNLCDNAGIMDEEAFRHLHYAMTDALDPEAAPRDYYAHYPYKEDGGYLQELVTTCQSHIRCLPSYDLVKPQIQNLAGLYSELQTYKHLDPAVREEKMLSWIDKHLLQYPELTPWEFAAATGSTLGMFILCAAASEKNLTPAVTNAISNAYFPWISGLHILLDYFIDAAEDKKNDDLNFVAYYQDSSRITARLSLFIRQAFVQAAALPHPEFHTTVVQGLLAMYLSDPKANAPEEQAIKNSLLTTAGGYTRFLYFLCKLLRFRKKL